MAMTDLNSPPPADQITSSASHSRPIEPCVCRDPKYSNLPPKVASWFMSRLNLSETHKRIAHSFCDVLQSHSSKAASGKKDKNDDARSLSTTRLDAPISLAHPIEDLLSETYLSSYDVGTGESLTNLQCARALEAEYEVIIVTGFLHPSSASVRSLNRTLEVLATRQTLKNVRRGTDNILKVHICFSSSGFLQKVLHTRDPKGRIWKEKEWKKLGLADPTYLKGKIDLTVKSLFFRPVGLLHGKYMIVDRRMLVVPSANLSWEEWLEGATTYICDPEATTTGTINVVKQFVRYWESVWMVGEEPGPEEFERVWESFPVTVHEGGGSIIMDKFKGTPVNQSKWLGWAPTIFLPHPEQGSFPPVWPLGEVQIIWRIIRKLMGAILEKGPDNDEGYLSNPQNAFIFAAIEGAEESIYLHTPNVTAKPIMNALVRAVKRGVTVEIVTSMGMMKWEQLVTAGTTTEKCLQKMVKEIGKFKESTPDGAITTGGFFVYQYNPTKRPQLPPFVKNPNDNHKLTWYDKSHVKCLIIDEQVVMLGSGNADRASWVTSQEVNIGLFLNKAKAGIVRQALVNALAGRLEVLKGSGWVTGGEGDYELSYGVDGVPRRKRNDPEA
ncbi:hypothetical protein H072_10239 [Dactylellina haptotyla CBS 200.50]|uniref:PLD phosphodiesterase domain-containing protein n=1 Tax=Dactylellina haptotyla (strain CBS 200.50) TaxID=1284197 RepID=S8BAU2_DACHA|nr:hypothetical protein H072_10239 [Dactylellina haptotyla CBS 200.50]